MSKPLPISDRVLNALLDLKEAGSLPLAQTKPGSGVWRFTFRAAGWPISVDLDTTVCMLRAYHGNDVIATGRVSERAIDALVEGAERPAPPPDRASLDGLRAVVRDWKNSNAWIYTKSPDVARHPDGWNNS